MVSEFLKRCQRAQEVLEGCTPYVRDWLFIFHNSWGECVVSSENAVDSLPYREQFAKATGLTLDRATEIWEAQNILDTRDAHAYA